MSLFITLSNLGQLGLIALVLSGAVGWLSYTALRDRLRSRRDRHTPLAVGQIWRASGNGDRYRIAALGDDAVKIAYQEGSYAFTYTYAQDKWEEMQIRMRMYLQPELARC